MSIKTAQAILKCFIDLKSSVYSHSVLFVLEGSDPFKLALTFEVKKSVEKRPQKCTVRTS